MARELLDGWLTAIGQQNKAIRRKNKIINRLRKEAEEREQYLATLKREFNLHNTVLHTRATAMDVQWGGSVRESVDKAIARIAELDRERAALNDQLIVMGTALTRERGEWEKERVEFIKRIAQLRAEHGDLVRRNALLRERHDLPVDRIPAHEELERLQQGLRVGDHVRVTMPEAGEDMYGVITESVTAEPIFASTGEALPSVAYATTVADQAKPPTDEACALELEAAEEALGAWMSAALGDPGTCKVMKDDINRWFAAMASCTERYPTVWAYEQACAALDKTHKLLEASDKRNQKLATRVKDIQQSNSRLYLRTQKYADQLSRMHDALKER